MRHVAFHRSCIAIIKHIFRAGRGGQFAERICGVHLCWGAAAVALALISSAHPQVHPAHCPALQEPWAGATVRGIHPAALPQGAGRADDGRGHAHVSWPLADLAWPSTPSVLKGARIV